MNAAHVSYGMVKPRIDDELAKLKEALTTCQSDQLTRLQERIAALRQITIWFERTTLDTQIFDQAV